MACVYFLHMNVLYAQKKQYSSELSFGVADHKYVPLNSLNAMSAEAFQASGGFVNKESSKVLLDSLNGVCLNATKGLPQKNAAKSCYDCTFLHVAQPLLTLDISILLWFSHSQTQTKPESNEVPPVGGSKWFAHLPIGGAHGILMLSSNLLKSKIPMLRVGGVGGLWNFDAEFKFAKIQNSHVRWGAEPIFNF